MLHDPAKLIKKFDSRKDLDDYVAQELIEECQKPGLILLPTGETFEKEIYPIVNDYFAEHKDRINSRLILSHLDERLTEDESLLFGKRLQDELSNLADKFEAIDTSNIDKFNKLISQDGGPRLIYMGLGKDPQRAHVAYIGEEYINKHTAVIELSPAARPKPSVIKAVTIGMDVFEHKNLESIRVVATTQAKAEALKSAFTNPLTGLGSVIQEHSAKLQILCDNEANTLC